MTRSITCRAICIRSLSSVGTEAEEGLPFSEAAGVLLCGIAELTAGVLLWGSVELAAGALLCGTAGLAADELLCGIAELAAGVLLCGTDEPAAGVLLCGIDEPAAGALLTAESSSSFLSPAEGFSSRSVSDESSDPPDMLSWSDVSGMLVSTALSAGRLTGPEVCPCGAAQPAKKNTKITAAAQLFIPENRSTLPHPFLTCRSTDHAHCMAIITNSVL
ncbi:MAG: hypothetical protein PUC59_07850 [Firmicutes bacterium]|nr:hypothetical protein [Bacillota bacterium]